MEESPLDSPHEILSVEDNPADIRLIGELVKMGKGSCTVRFVRDGVEALDYLYKRGAYASAQLPALILLDLNLPKKDGRQVLKEIKEEPSLKTIPVVIFTSSSDRRDITDSYALFASCYIVKPVTLYEFDLVLKRIQEFWLKTVQLPREKLSVVS